MPFLDNSTIIAHNNSLIYTGQDEPIDPETGMIWNEVDSDDNLIQQWIYSKIEIDFGWSSSVNNWTFTNLSHSGQISQSIECTLWDLFIRDFYCHMSSPTISISGSSFYERRLAVGNMGGISHQIVSTIRFQNTSVGQHYFVKNNINTKVVTNPLIGSSSSTKFNLISIMQANNLAQTGINTLVGFTYSWVRKIL
jgi:hypothetical protein